MEQRKHQRSKAFLGGRVVFNGSNSSFDCIVKQISVGGALVKVENALSVPESFSLVLSDGRRFDCEVRWRRINSLGVKFLTDGL
ncbi:PilZ domain-containing protein [Neorhizobium lilium]|uniref:PilZ domain-containing protein n=1 Tax=Neorhizobium lilium TaxID=2503024 RepID=A0A3S3SFP4_9HYPH|nr:PilZ domain-containing protein [Neorhizobium lilium]RWX79192.1 PilZ domain-containing protein [Neorhizobium lilium]